MHLLLFIPGVKPSGNVQRVLRHLWGHDTERGPFTGGVGRGNAIVSAFNPSLNGVEYVTKGLGQQTQTIEGGLYELNKFKGENLELSNSLVRYLKKDSARVYDKPPQGVESGDTASRICGAGAVFVAVSENVGLQEPGAF